MEDNVRSANDTHNCLATGWPCDLSKFSPFSEPSYPLLSAENKNTYNLTVMSAFNGMEKQHHIEGKRVASGTNIPGFLS